MTPEKMLDDVMAYFAQGKYPDAVKERMRAIIASIGDDEREAVTEHLIETQKASFKVGVSDIVESCRALGIGFRAARFVPAVEWYCDACGYNFKYAQASGDDEKIDLGLHDVCPMCGFQPNWTLTKDAYAKMGALTRAYLENYRKRIVECVEKHGASPSCGRGPSGPYWARSKAEQERRDAAKKPIQPEWMRASRATAEAQELIG